AATSVTPYYVSRAKSFRSRCYFFAAGSNFFWPSLPATASPPLEHTAISMDTCKNHPGQFVNNIWHDGQYEVSSGKRLIRNLAGGWQLLYSVARRRVSGECFFLAKTMPLVGTHQKKLSLPRS
ncbi:MAG: hypothetical protein AB7U73_16625, partial [Pirellulales bacterium]